MGTRFFYYCILIPISRLPFFVLYRISDVLFVSVYHIFKYRRKVVFNNLKNSFPNQDIAWLKEKERKFYQHLCDLIVEAIKGFTISKKEALKRMKYKNPEILEKYSKGNQDILFVGGHFNNWELYATSIGLHIDFVPIGIYKPLKNKFLDRKMKESRGRYGMVLCPMKETKEFIVQPMARPKAIIMASDQSPSNPAKAFWTTFLNQESAVLFGAEKYSKDFNLPVVYSVIHKLKRGHYIIESKILFDNPGATNYGEITIKHTQKLEQDINENPEFWLWSHKRWKHKKPADLNQESNKTEIRNDFTNQSNPG